MTSIHLSNGERDRQPLCGFSGDEPLTHRADVVTCVDCAGIADIDLVHVPKQASLIPMANGSLVVSCDLNEIVGSPSQRVEGYVLAWALSQEWVTWFVWRDIGKGGMFEATGGTYHGTKRLVATMDYEQRRGYRSAANMRWGQPEPTFKEG